MAAVRNRPVPGRVGKEMMLNQKHTFTLRETPVGINQAHTSGKVKD